MKKKIVYGMTLGLAVSAASVFAAEEVATTSTDATVSTEQVEALPEGPSILERLAALEADAKKSSWAENIKFKGDLRYRYEYKAEDDETAANRHRIRARIGAYSKVNDNVNVGIRLATGSDTTNDGEHLGSDSTSSNQTIEDDFSQKPIWLDLAYITLGCEQIEGLSATFGKMKQPWVSVSDLIFDTDVNPEGIASVYEFGNDDITFTSTIGYHMLDDKGAGDDDNLTSGQIAIETGVSEGIALTAGAGAYFYSEMDYKLIDGFVQANIKTDVLPIKVYGEYLNNTEDDVDEDTAWLAGIGTTCPITGIKVDYNYRDIETDSVNPGLDDSDFGGAGKGHKIKAQYGLAKNTTLGATYFRTERTSGREDDLLQVDLVVKF